VELYLHRNKFIIYLSNIVPALNYGPCNEVVRGHIRQFTASSVPDHRIMVKVKFSLEQAMKAQRGSRGIALLFP
jgi:hypothetical protein